MIKGPIMDLMSVRDSGIFFSACMALHILFNENEKCAVNIKANIKVFFSAYTYTLPLKEGLLFTSHLLFRV